jgi:hypothetical protein
MYFGLVSHEVLSGRVVSVYIFFNYLGISKYGQEKILEISAVQIVTTDKTKVIIIIRCLQYDAHSGFLHKISTWSFCSNRQYFCGQL